MSYGQQCFKYGLPGRLQTARAKVYGMLPAGKSCAGAQPRRRRKVKPSPAPQAPRPARRRKVKTPRSNSPWWLLGEFTVTANTPPGTVERLLLHPEMFPDTPYYSQCAHHTHRRERRWELQIRVTTASNTGFRAAVLILADPYSTTQNLPSSLIWSTVMQKRGAIATSTGTGTTTARLQVPNTTGLLSNASPPPGSVVGFATGTVVVHLLDPPIGIAGDNRVSITVLARVELSVFGPMSGFMSWSSQPTPGPGPGPSPAEVAFTVTVPPANNILLNNHMGSAWLAGGMYWRFPDAPGSDWAGEVKCYAIYQPTEHEPYDWEDNNQTKKYPQYIVTWEEPGSAVMQFVGFEDFEQALHQASGHTGIIPGGAECCISYRDTTVTWQSRWRGLTGSSTAISFTLVRTTDITKDWWKASGRALLAPPPAPAAAPRLPESRGLSGPTRPATTWATQLSWPNRAGTSALGLTEEINALRSTVQELRAALATPSEFSSRYSPASRLEPPSPLSNTSRATTPSRASLPLGSSVDYPPPLTSSGAFAPRSSSCPPQLTQWLSPSGSYAAPSPLLAGTTLPPTGCRPLPSTWALQECPGCEDPNCSDCFEDDDDGELTEVVSVPSEIGSIDSLVAALSRLGGTDV